MDRKHFDALARLVGSRGSRRSAIAALVGATVLGNLPDESDAKHDRTRRRRKQRRRRNRPCYPGTACVLGRSSNGEACDFSGSTAFKGADLRFARLAGANLSNVNASGADLRGADLRGACIVESNLFEAQLGTANLNGAIFCNTIMPDGSFNAEGCEQATACCPRCASGDCPLEEETCVPLGNVCSVWPFFPSCCANTVCLPPIISKFALLTWCQDKGCSSTAQCQARYPTLDVVCEDDGVFGCIPLVNECCRNQRCLVNTDCAKSGVCCSFLDLGIARCCAPGQRCTKVGCL